MKTDILATIIREAGALALAHFHRGSALIVEAKGPFDLVTEADRAVEALIRDRLAVAFPQDGIFGEEGCAIPGRSGRSWVVDPIDGTFNFVRGSDDWAISIGSHTAQGPGFGAIYRPVRDTLLVGGRDVGARLDGRPLAALRPFDPSVAAVGLGFHRKIPTDECLAMIRYLIDDADVVIRHTGSATMSLLSVALGHTDGYVALGDSPWDVMAGLAILDGLGGTSTLTWPTIRMTDKLFFACGSAGLVDRVRPSIELGFGAGRVHG